MIFMLTLKLKIVSEKTEKWFLSMIQYEAHICVIRVCGLFLKKKPQVFFCLWFEFVSYLEGFLTFCE